MKTLAELSNQELQALQQSVAEWASTISRNLINQQFRMSSYKDRQFSAIERLQSTTAEVNTIETIIVSLQNAGADARTISEYEKKRDMAQLRKKLAEANAERYSDISLLKLAKETELIQQEELTMQAYAEEISALLA